MLRAGVAGLGRMGAVYAERLAVNSFSVSVWNRTPSRALPLAEYGAVGVATPCALSSSSDVILSALSDDRAVKECYLGPDGLLSAPVEGKLFIEMSTIRPETIRHIAEEAQSRGAAVIDAPVSGTVGPARQGQLVIVVGGEVADVERAKSVLSLLGRQTTHMGDVGSGAAMKLVLNMALAVYWQSLAEAIAMGELGGLSRDAMLDVIADSPISTPALNVKMPLLKGTGGEIGFDIAGVKKDMMNAVLTAHSLGVPASTAASALACYTAATSNGFAKRDVVEIVDYLKQLTSLPSA